MFVKVPLGELFCNDSMANTDYDDHHDRHRNFSNQHILKPPPTTKIKPAIAALIMGRHLIDV
ncbi:hypothetical protein BLOT_000781 [Blomia tropicalis]|nr:hypothetical protein BLOT_000781 [Blomia tropicalis]